MITDVVKMIDGKTHIKSLELVRGISINSKMTKPGDVFFALKGERTDGHFYTKEALHNGAVGVVVEKDTGCGAEILVSDTLFALGKLAQEYRSFFRPRTIGITGTNGKTTVKNLITAILNKKYRVLCTKKNFNSLIGLPLILFELSYDQEYLVVEMGTSSPGEIRRLCEIARPHIGLITNIGPGHLQGLGSIEGIRQEKLSLVKCLPEDGFALVGEDVGDIERKNIMRFSLKMLEDIELGENGSQFSLDGNSYFTPLLGIGNVYNCLAALCLTSKMGVEYDIQREAIADVRPEPGRMEPIRDNGLFIINDTYNANPVSMRAAMDFAAVLKRKKVFILGDMRELGEESKRLHVEIGDYARKHCELLLTYGDEATYYQGKHFKDKYALTRFLVKNLYGDEAILIKASRALQFEEIVQEMLRLLR